MCCLSASYCGKGIWKHMTTTATNVSVFPSFGNKLTIDPLLNLQEHVLRFLQVSSDMQRAMTIREMLTAREVRALAISPSTFDT